VRPSLVAALCVASLAALRSPASANAPAPFVRVGANEGGVFLQRPTSLVVEHEEVTFRCDGGTCDFRAVYHVLNPTGGREEVLGAFYGIASDRFEAKADGSDARRTITDAQRTAIDDSVAALDPSLLRDVERVTREGFVLGVDAHARATLVFSGRMAPVSFATRAGVTSAYTIAPLETRHPWLGTRARTDSVDEFEYALSPIRGWAGSPDIDVVVRCGSARLWRDGQAGWTVGEDEEGFAARQTVAAADAGTLRFDVVRAGTTVLHGGPLIGVGAHLGAGELRARLGYEAALPWWVIYSASIETDFRNTTTIAPVVEVASPDLLVLVPSIGLGAGVPVQLRSGEATRVGARMQLTLSFPVLSLVLPVDVFPGATTDVWQVSLFGQASF
jgi:hypothetical protein